MSSLCLSGHENKYKGEGAELDIDLRERPSKWTWAILLGKDSAHFLRTLPPWFSHGVYIGAALGDLLMLVDLQWPIRALFCFVLFSSLGPEKIHINSSPLVEALRGKTWELWVSKFPCWRKPAYRERDSSQHAEGSMERKQRHQGCLWFPWCTFSWSPAVSSLCLQTGCSTS